MGKMVDEYGSDTKVKGWCLSKSQTCDLLGIGLYHMGIKMKDGTSPKYRRSTGTKKGRLYFDFVAVARWIVENQVDGIEFR